LKSGHWFVIGAATLAASVTACTALLGDFNTGSGGDGGPEAEGGPGDSSESDSSTDGPVGPQRDGSGGGDAPTDAKGSFDGPAGDADAAPQCPNGLTYCGGTCVDVSKSPGDCGQCNHVCSLHTMYGSSTCVSSVCTPVAFIADVLETFVGVAADNATVFVHVTYDGGGGISECPAGSCTSLSPISSTSGTYSPPIFAAGGTIAWGSQMQGHWAPEDGGAVSNTPFYNIGAGLHTMVLGGGNVAYLWYDQYGKDDYVTMQAAAGETWTTPMLNGGPVTAPIAMDSTNMVFAFPGDAGTLQSCPIASGCTAPVPVSVMPSFAQVLSPYVYETVPPAANVDAGSVVGYVTVSSQGTGLPTALTTLSPGVSVVQTAIDSTGFYWLDSAGNISACPLAPASCPKGGVPVLLASSGNPATQFAVWNGQVFFLSSSQVSTVFEAPPAAF
jgi:hypothetical protein